MKKTLLIAAIAFLVTFPSRVEACTCGTILPCQAYAGAQVVFVGLVTKSGTVKSTGLMPSNAMSTTLTNGATSAHFKIEEAVLGIERGETDVFGGGTTCDYYFKAGERYLVYAYRGRDGNTLHTNICAGTAPLKDARKYLAYLREPRNRASGSVFFGWIRREFYNSRKNQIDGGGASGTLVIIESERQSFRARSNVKGDFIFAGLHGGRYRVRTIPEANYSSIDIMSKRPQTEWEVDIPDHGCLREWFNIRPQGEISGRLIGLLEKLHDVELEIAFADRANENRNELPRVIVDDEGRFTFSFLHPGRYLLGFNIQTGPFLNFPYPEFYYPGVTDRSSAKIISVGHNQKINDITLPVPERAAERTLEGVAVWPNGKPAANVRINLINSRTGWREGNGVTTDEHGRFSIIGMEGQTYGVSALINKGIPLVDSKPVMIKVGKINAPVRLVIRLP